MYLRGRVHLELAEAGDDWDKEVKAAQRWFGLAHKADPNHFQTLYRFAQSHRRGPASTSENTANVILLAQQLAPQVTEIRLNAAALLIARNELDIAKTLLAPLIVDPHDRGLAAAARKMLEEATERSASADAEEQPAESAATRD